MSGLPYGEQTAIVGTVNAAVQYIQTRTNGPAKNNLLAGLQKDGLVAAALQRHQGSYITIVYNDDNPDMGALVQRLFFNYSQMNIRRLATSEGQSWVFSYP